MIRDLRKFLMGLFLPEGDINSANKARPLCLPAPTPKAIVAFCYSYSVMALSCSRVAIQGFWEFHFCSSFPGPMEWARSLYFNKAHLFCLSVSILHPVSSFSAFILHFGTLPHISLVSTAHLAQSRLSEIPNWNLTSDNSLHTNLQIATKIAHFTINCTCPISVLGSWGRPWAFGLQKILYSLPLQRSSPSVKFKVGI